MSGMENKQPLLSICIPTYNRAEYLEEAIYNIVTDDAFCDKVEIIISDNASTDNTKQVGEKFANRYSNVHYYRNIENIRDKNFILALQRAKGKYVRLFNDTLRLRSGILSHFLYLISVSSEDEPLFFYQNISFLNENRKIVLHDVSGFINETSFFVTWIANFGNWKKYIDSIPDPNRCSYLLLAQVDWSLGIVNKYASSVIYFGDFFQSIVPHNKGGYNFFKVFVDNYLKIIRSYNPKRKTLEREKYRLYRYHLLRWFILFKQNKNKYSFEKSNVWGILLQEYWYYPYFYLGLLLSHMRRSIGK